jgi:small subunit ribosomal protein S1
MGNPWMYPFEGPVMSDQPRPHEELNEAPKGEISEQPPTPPAPDPQATAEPTPASEAQPAPEAPPAATPPPAPRPTVKPPKADDPSIEGEVAAAMSQMSAEDLAELTLGMPPAAGPQQAPAGMQLGRIAAVHGDDVFIDLGGKTQGVLPKGQFKPDESLAIGEPVEVFIDRYDRDSDLIVLSRKGHARSAQWDLLKPGDLVEGRVVGLNRGGLEVQCKGLKAFMPASHVDVQHVKDISIFLNEPVTCEVMEIDRRGKRMTVSRRRVLEKERAAKRDELIQELEVGQVRKGVVGNITDFGAFVDLGGVDGLVHISDMSWSNIQKPTDVVKVGDIIDVKVLKIQDDKGKKRISLGLKQAQPDPWESVPRKYPVNSTQRVRVVRLADFGAFAELEEGIEGLIPISEMSYSRIGKPQEVVQVGQTVDVAVIRVEPDRRRIALSIKQAQPDPWAEVMTGYEPDSWIDGKVTKLTSFGAFVEIAPGVEGMIHISELSDRRVKSCADVVKPGQDVKARVLNIDAQQRRIALSLKPAASAAPVSDASADFGRSKPKKKGKPRRGGLAAEWDWAGVGLDGLGSIRGNQGNE